MTQRNKIAASCGVVALLGFGTLAAVYQTRRANESARARLVYQADGYGGFAPRSPITPAVDSRTAATPLPSATPTPAIPPPATGIDLARAAYARGDYRATEAAAQKVLAAGSQTNPARASVSVASARHLMAFAAARQGDLKTARTRFAEARGEAERAERAEARSASLPKASPSPTAPGEMPQPTLAEDAAYQHAACTMGLGDKAGAERELIQFVRDFPESPLVHGAMRRIAKLHGGDIPKDAEAVWKSAQVIQRKSQEERERNAAMCAPESLAHLLNGAVPVETLAQKMKTGADGTTLFALVETAKRHGFPEARGVRLTEAGLKKQASPLIALIAPGHFVVVSAVSASGVTVWDASGGAGQIGSPPPPNPGGAGGASLVPSRLSGERTSPALLPAPPGLGGGGQRPERIVSWQEWRKIFSGVAVSGLKTAEGSNDVISKQ